MFTRATRGRARPLCELHEIFDGRAYKRTPSIAYGGARRMLTARLTPSATMPPPPVSRSAMVARRRGERPATRLLAGEKLIACRRAALARRRFSMQGGSELVGEGCTLVLADSRPTRRAHGCPLAKTRRGAARVEGERIRDACSSPGREIARRARQLACMHEARCSLPSHCPLTGFAMHHHRSSELATDHLLLELLAARRPVLASLVGSELGAHAWSRLAVVISIKLGVRGGGDVFVLVGRSLWCSPTIIRTTARCSWEEEEA
ncbi:hypothetical protein Dimus_007053, partial [Dionaea muscipula]